MYIRRKLFLMVVAAAPLAAAADSASAQCGGYLGCGYDIGRLYSVLSNNVPYYSAFPPVYYSYPVPRTYGHSPFAYLPTKQTPDVAMQPAPVAINNPYFEQSVEPATVDAQPQMDQTASATPIAPLMIHNPFVPTIDSLDGGPILQAARRNW